MSFLYNDYIIFNLVLNDEYFMIIIEINKFY